MTPFFLRLRAWWETADRTQRVVTLFGAALLVCLCVGTVYFASRPKFALLYGGLTSAEQGSVVDELTTMGVEYQLGSNGTVLVPAAMVTETRAKLAVAGKQPTSGHIGYESFDNMGMMVTPKVEQERIKAAIEGELANSIEKIEGVTSARVHITLGDQSAFVREKEPSSASVVLSEAQTGAVGLESGRAIARLVQNAVTGLQAENISIVSTDGRMLYDGRAEEAGSGIADRKVQAEIAEARRRETDLQRKLDLAFGPGNTIASIPILEMNFDERSSRETVRTPSDSPLRREQVKETMGSGSTSGTPSASGIDANNPQGPSITSGREGGENTAYNGTQESTEFITNEKTSDVREATGEITAMAINVLVNEAKIDSKDKVDEFLRGYLGPKTEDPAFTFGSTLVSFDTSAQKAAATAAAGSASSARMQQVLSILPIAALVLVGFMVMKSLQKVGGSSDVVVAALPGGGTAPLAMGSGSRTFASDHGPLELPPGAEITVNEHGQQVITQPGGPTMILEASHQKPVAIGAIEEKVHVPLEQIRRMANERPHTVAMLLKSWLLEER